MLGMAPHTQRYLFAILDQAVEDNSATLLTEKQLASMLHMSISAIRKRRTDNLPPAFIRIGKSIRYRPETVQAFLLKEETVK
jgi:predicted DNA-binding transcriptional regulator AlpA